MRLKSNRAQVDHLAFERAGRAHEDAVRALFQFDKSHFLFNELVEAAGSADLALEYAKVGFDQPGVPSVIVVHGVKEVDLVATGGQKVDLPQGGVALVHPGTDQVEVGVITKLLCKKLRRLGIESELALVIGPDRFRSTRGVLACQFRRGPREPAVGGCFALTGDQVRIDWISGIAPGAPDESEDGSKVVIVHRA